MTEAWPKKKDVLKDGGQEQEGGKGNPGCPIERPGEFRGKRGSSWEGPKENYYSLGDERGGTPVSCRPLGESTRTGRKVETFFVPVEYRSGTNELSFSPRQKKSHEKRESGLGHRGRKDDEPRGTGGSTFR